MTFTQRWAAAGALLALSGAAQAALIDRGGGMIYDTTRNLTWLADMNHAETSGYAAAHAGGTGPYEIRANGQMGWNAAVAWADGLVYGGFSDWRLPTVNMADTTCLGGIGSGVNCSGGELSGLMIADLGYNTDGGALLTADDTAQQVANQALFRNQPLGGSFWTNTAHPTLPDWAAVFDAFFMGEPGIQGWREKELAHYAMAVRTGDVAAAVPEPQTLALALLALGATALARRQRPA